MNGPRPLKNPVTVPTDHVHSWGQDERVGFANVGIYIFQRCVCGKTRLEKEPTV